MFKAVNFKIMTGFLVITFCFSVFVFKLTTAQCALKPSCPPTPLSSPLPPRSSSSLTIIRTPSSKSTTTYITDATPQVCQNLANTIQLMYVSNVIQTRKELGYPPQVITSLVNNLLSSPLCQGPLNQILKDRGVTLVRPLANSRLPELNAVSNVCPKSPLARVLSGL